MNYNDELSREFECYAAAIQSSELLQEIKKIMADIPGLVKTVSAGANTLQKLADIAMQTQNIELREGILSVREELINIKESLLDVREENLELKTENKTLKDRISELEKPKTEELTLRGKFYFTADDRGPYCPQCWESQKKKTLISNVGGIKVCSVGCGYKTM